MQTLPKVVAIAINKACRPNVLRLLMICGFVPTEAPNKKSRANMVYEIGFPIFCKIETLLNKYPAAIPANMMPMTVNIADLYK